MRLALLPCAGLLLAAASLQAAPASAACVVDLGDCDGGDCTVNLRTCEGGARCDVNAGWCRDGGDCEVNLNTCVGGDCEVNSGWCPEGDCTVNLDHLWGADCVEGRCRVNLGYCGPDARCPVNLVTC